MLDTFTLQTFLPLVSEDFILRVGTGATLPITLISAESLLQKNANNQFTREPFSLIFRGPLSSQLPQGTFQLEHPALSSEVIFFVPIKFDAMGVYYEAVFN